MASPKEIAPTLPETLPEDFSEWDNEGSPAAMPVHSLEWEVEHPFSETAIPLGQPIDRDSAAASLVDKPPSSGTASSAPVSIKQQDDNTHGVSGASPSAKPLNSRDEWEAWIEAHSFTETPKPFGQSVDRGSSTASLVDMPRASGSSPTAPVSLKQQEESSDGDDKASPPAKPVQSRDEWQAWIAAHSVDKTPKQHGQSVEHKAVVSPAADRPRVSDTAVSAPFLVNEKGLTSRPAEGLSNRYSQGLAASPAKSAASAVPGLPNGATANGTRISPEPAAKLNREVYVPLFQSDLSKDVEVKDKQKTAKKKWMIIAPVSAGSILLLLVFMAPLVHHGSKPIVKQSVQPPPDTTDAQLATNTPNTSANEPLTQEQPRATTEVQSATAAPPSDAQAGMKPPQVPTETQTEMMDHQLTAPTRIPQGVDTRNVEDSPPPASFGTAGAEDGLGGNSANVSAFNGHAHPVAKVVPSSPVKVSSGVAAGMLIQMTQPIYPAIAKAARVSGTVEMSATISKNGTIKDVHVMSGPAMLQQAAVDAVRNWRYKPYMLNNQPIEIETTIKLVFSLGQ
jgi:protein TonB